MTARERERIRNVRDAAARDALATIAEAHMMVRWVDCPVHGLKVGQDKAGWLVGRCSECAAESAEATVMLEAGLVA